MTQFVNIAIVVFRIISKKIDLMLKDMRDMIYITRALARKNIVYFFV